MRLLESFGCNVVWCWRYNDNLYYIYYDIFIFSCFWSYLYVWLFDINGNFLKNVNCVGNNENWIGFVFIVLILLIDK